MKRRNFIKIFGSSTLALGIVRPSLSSPSPSKPKKPYDNELPLWGSPYYGDTQSTLNFKKATYEQMQKEFAQFHMSEKPRDLYLFNLSS